MKKRTSIGHFLKEKRVEVGLTQNELSKIFGYTSSQFISNIERDLAQPPLKTLKFYMRVLKISEEEMYSIMSENYNQLLRSSIFGQSATGKSRKRG